MKNQELLIAKRYAQAFSNVLPITLEDLPRIKDAIEFLDRHDEVFLMLKIPLLDAHIKTQALEDYLLGRFKLPESFKTLIQVLVAAKRSYLLNEVLRRIAELFEEDKEIEFFEIASSAPLDQDDLGALQKFLSQATKHTVIAKPVHDASLIAGIRMQSTQHVWEYSVRKQLAAVRAKLNE